MLNRILRCCRRGNRRGLIGQPATTAHDANARPYRIAASRAIGLGTPANTANGRDRHHSPLAASGRQKTPGAAPQYSGRVPPAASRSWPSRPSVQHWHGLRSRVTRDRTPLHTQRHGETPTHRSQKPLWRAQKANSGHERQRARAEGGDTKRSGRAVQKT